MPETAALPAPAAPASVAAAALAPLCASFALWSRFAGDNATMLQSASEVIGRRTAAMAAHGLSPDARERKELRRMVEEKHSALVDGSVAAWSEMVRLQQAGWLEAVRVAMQVSNGLVALTGVPAAVDWPAGMAPQPSWPSWPSFFDSQLRIADAAFAPIRNTVAANRKRLAA